MKKLSIFKRILALALATLCLGLFAGCGEEKKQTTLSDLQSQAEKMARPEAEREYKIIIKLINERADLIPNFMEKEKDHSMLKFSEDAFNDVLEARNTVKEAKTIDEISAACVKLDESVYLWSTSVSTLNPNTNDHCLAELRSEISESSSRISSLIINYNNLVERYNKTVSKEKQMEKFVLPKSEILENVKKTK